MLHEWYILIGSAMVIACLHTATGPDHYLPFIALSKSRNWSVTRTICWTILCGCGHVWSSVLLGLGGAAIGWSMLRIHALEQLRGGLAGWVMLGFGLVYGLWGLFTAAHNRRHRHFDWEQDGSLYVFEHRHGELVVPGERHKVTPWVLVLLFVMGPSEPMIPLLYAPGTQSAWLLLVCLVLVYTFSTVLTMSAMVLIGFYGTVWVQGGKLEKYMHAIGGLTLFICGIGMVYLHW